MNEMRKKLFEVAKAARDNAYAPYSDFRVGAAILADNGKIYAGGNVENAVYPQGLCAEAVAIGAMIAGGAKKIRDILIIADGPKLCTPCGACRQKMYEFADHNTKVHVSGLEGYRKTFNFSDLLPAPFGLENLPHDDSHVVHRKK